MCPNVQQVHGLAAKVLGRPVYSPHCHRTFYSPALAELSLPVSELEKEGFKITFS